MIVYEAERRAEQRRRSDPVRDREIELSQHQVLKFADWCLLVGVSPATGRRMLKSGRGPSAVQLSARRIGIPLREHLAWLEARRITNTA